MPVFRTLSILFTLTALVLPGLAGAQGFMAVEQPAGAARHACLNRTEQRAAVASHKAVPLAAAIKSLRERGHRAEVVRAELCNRGERLVYVLTLLARNGKVTRATVDAANGEPINGH
ncbi:MAG: hypothetical protein PSV22_12465 [Pseudolabrys sp.]|nr:hypothetical protein [Pseudolabrys sp.]